jgi:hypothetical protein
LPSLWFFLSGAIRQVRENKRLGIKFQWAKFFATMGGVVVVMGLGLGCLFLGLSLDRPLIAALYLVIFIGGLVGLFIWANRRWPTPAV